MNIFSFTQLAFYELIFSVGLLLIMQLVPLRAVLASQQTQQAELSFFLYAHCTISYVKVNSQIQLINKNFPV